MPCYRIQLSRPCTTRTPRKPITRLWDGWELRGAGGNSGVILKDHGGGEPGEFELVIHCMLIRFETFRSCGSEKDFAGPCLIHIFPRHCLVKWLPNNATGNQAHGQLPWGLKRTAIPDDDLPQPGPEPQEEWGKPKNRIVCFQEIAEVMIPIISPL
jgi:hypothetical protein